MSDRAWIADWRERPGVDSRLCALLLGTVERVRYVEIAYGEGPVYGGGDFDSVDFGIEIDLAGGRHVAIVWVQSGDGEGILVCAGRLQPDHVAADAEVATWDVTARWHELGGRRIDGVSSLWSRWRRQPGDRLTDFMLEGLRLRWDTGRETIVVRGERHHETGAFQWTHANLAVFFGEASAIAHGVDLQDQVDPSSPRRAIPFGRHIMRVIEH